MAHCSKPSACGSGHVCECGQEVKAEEARK